MSDIQECIAAYRAATAALQADIAVTHARTFAKYKGAFEGRSAVLIGGGPTAKIFTPIPDAIYVACNDAPLRHDIDFDFMVAVDYAGILDIIEAVAPVKHKLFGTHLSLVFNQIPQRYFSTAEKFYYFNMDRRRDDMQYSLNLERECLNTPSSSVFAAVLFLLYAKVSTIYLVGFDGKSGSHSILGQTAGKNSRYQYEASIEGWKGIKDFIQRERLKTQIVSVHPRGLKGLFKDLNQNSSALAAVEAYDDGRYTQALTFAEKALRESGNSEACEDLYAQILRKADTRKFLSFVARKLGENPRWWLGTTLLAEYYSHRDNPDMCFYCLDKAEALCGDSVNRQNLPLKITHALQLYRWQRLTALRQYLDKLHCEAFGKYFGFRLYKSTWFRPSTEEILQTVRDSLIYDRVPAVVENLLLRLRSLGRYEEAEHVLCENTRTPYEIAYAPWRQHVFLERRRGNIDKEYTFAKKMFLNAPTWINAWQHMLDTLLRMDRVDEANDLVQALQDNVFHFDLSYYLSRIAEKQHNIPRAIHFAHRAVKHFNFDHHTEFLPFIFHYCHLLRKTGNFKESLQTLSSCLHRHHNLPQVIQALSVHHEEYGDMLKACRYAEKLHNINNYDKTFSARYFSILLKMGCVEKAITLLRHLAIDEPKCSQAYYHLALCYDAKNDYENSIACIDTAIDMDRHNRTYMILSLRIRQKKSLVNAILYCFRYIYLNKNSGYLYSILSTLYENQKNLLLIDYAYYGYEISPEDDFCFNRLINVLIQNNMHKQALSIAQCYSKTHCLSPAIFAQIYEKIDISMADKYYITECEERNYYYSNFKEKYMQFLEKNKDTLTKNDIVNKCLQTSPQWRNGWLLLLNSMNTQEEKNAYLQQCCDKNPAWAEMHYKFAMELDNQSDQKALNS